MRALRRNLQPFYYATYSGKTEIMEDGLHTGRYEVAYSTPVLTKGNISPARGSADMEMFGITANYSKTIVMGVATSIAEDTALWLGIMPVKTNTRLTVSVNGTTWEASELGGTDGTYEFTYSGSWKYDGSVKSLSTLGITYTGTPKNGDVITIVRKTTSGVVSVSAYATEAVPHNYVVTQVAKSLNSTTYAVKEVENGN